MEVIEYVHPQSWDDKGMDWSDPDPRRADYMMALRDAFLERMCAPVDGYYAYESNIVRMSPWKPVSAESLRWIVNELEYLCRFYYNLDPKVYKEDFSDFPRIMRLTDIVTKEDCECFMNASSGAILEHGGEWLRKIRNAINQLHVVQCYNAWGTTLTRSGSEHDPPFDESIGKAMERAFAEGQPREAEFKKTVPGSIYSWSGNNHWKCPIPTGRETRRITWTDTAATPTRWRTGFAGFAAGSRGARWISWSLRLSGSRRIRPATRTSSRRACSTRGRADSTRD